MLDWPGEKEDLKAQVIRRKGGGGGSPEGAGVATLRGGVISRFSREPWDMVTERKNP